jgi:hypothetical protein
MKARMVVAGCLAVLAVLLLGRAVVSQSIASGSKVGSGGGAQMRISTPRLQYRVDEKIVLQVVLTNEGTNTFELLTREPFPQDGILATHEQGGWYFTLYGEWVIYRETGGAFTHLTPELEKKLSARRELLPGQSLTNMYHLNRLCDMTLSGRYTITGVRELWNKSDPGKSVAVKSNPLVLTVLDEQ